MDFTLFFNMSKMLWLADFSPQGAFFCKKAKKVEDIPTFGYILHFFGFFLYSIMLRLWDHPPLWHPLRRAHAIQ